MWQHHAVVGFSEALHLVHLKSREVHSYPVPMYFGYLYALPERLLVASGEGLISIAPDGVLEWKSEILGVDGVVVEAVMDGIAHGQGGWDPPDGWRKFRLNVETGSKLNA